MWAHTDTHGCKDPKEPAKHRARDVQDNNKLQHKVDRWVSNNSSVGQTKRSVAKTNHKDMGHRCLSAGMARGHAAQERAHKAERALWKFTGMSYPTPALDFDVAPSGAAPVTYIWPAA